MDILAEILEKEQKKNERYKTTNVEKNLDIEFDLGNMLAVDTNDLDPSGKQREDWLRDLARDNTQLLLNSIWSLPTERVDGEVMVRLPTGTTVIPRAKRCPRPKPLTKWQRYAQEKGIANKKKTNVIWDDTLQQWVPRFGYRRAAAEKQRDWVVEVPQNADPMEDQFAKRAAARKEKVAKNEYQRLRNLAASKKIKVPKEGLPPVEKPSADQLNSAVGIARVSTASLGRFQPKLPQEKPSKSKVAKDIVAKKKKPNHALISAATERSSQLAIADSLLNKRPIIDIEKSVNCHINSEQTEHSDEKKKDPKSKNNRRKKGGMVRGKKGGRVTKNKHAGKKPKAGGRKRR